MVARSSCRDLGRFFFRQVAIRRQEAFHLHFATPRWPMEPIFQRAQQNTCFGVLAQMFNQFLAVGTCQIEATLPVRNQHALQRGLFVRRDFARGSAFDEWTDALSEGWLALSR